MALPWQGMHFSVLTPSFVCHDTIVVSIYKRFDSFPGYMQGEAAFADELGHFNTSKRASQVKDRKRATNTVNHQPKRRRVSQNIADKKHLDTNGRKLGMKICTEDQQKNNSVEPKGMSTKLRTEDRTSGSSTKRYSLLFADPIHLFFYLYQLYELYYLFFSCRLFCLCV